MVLNRNFANNFELSIADLAISIISADPSQRFEIPSPYDKFISNGKEPDAMLKAHFEIPSVELGKEMFSSDCWGLYANNGFRVFKLAPKMWGPLPIRLGVFNPDFRNGDIYSRDDYQEGYETDNGKHSFPFSYPMDEIVVINILSQASGFVSHACGISYRDRGYLFVGQSGAGKSTIADLWQRKSEVKILSDDRIVIRRQNGKLFAYGTPWHGEGKFFSTEKSKLERIFFLKQGKKNEVKMLNPVDAASRLFVCSFPTFYDATGMGNILDLINRIAVEIECYEVSFVPNMSITEFMSEHELAC